MIWLGLGLASYFWLGVLFIAGWLRRHPTWNFKEAGPIPVGIMIIWPIVAAFESCFWSFWEARR